MTKCLEEKQKKYVFVLGHITSDPWEDPLKKEMATCSSILAWKIPGTEKLGGLQSMGLQRVGHDGSTA